MVFGLTGCVWQIDDIGIYLPCILHGLISSARIVFNAENDQIRAVNHRTVSDLMGRLEMFFCGSGTDLDFIIILMERLLVVAIFCCCVWKYQDKCAVVITGVSFAS